MLVHVPDASLGSKRASGPRRNHSMHIKIGKHAGKAVCLPALLLGLIGSMWAQSGTHSNITQYPTPTQDSEPGGITPGPDGALWFAEYNADRIGRITTAGAITEFPTPTTHSGPWGIAVGADGALWFAADPAGRITTAGTFTEYPVPTRNGEPLGIAAGPDGALWFTEWAGNNIGRITIDGVVTEYPIPTPNSNPYGIAAGPDGALWFTEYDTGKIGRITTSGAVTEYPVAQYEPFGIAAGPDGALWFTEYAGDSIGRITTTGVATEYPAPATGSGLALMTAGPDGALWFTEWGGSKIGRNPACGLGFSATFANGTLTMDFNLGIDTPATFNILLRNPSGPIGVPFSKAIQPVVPPQAFTERWHNVPNLGEVTVQSTLTAGPGQVICSEWTTLSTAQ